MNHSDRLAKVHAEKQTEKRKQKPEKDAEADKSKKSSYNVVVEIRTGLNKIEMKLDRNAWMLEQGLTKEKKPEPLDIEKKSTLSDIGGLFEDLRRLEKKVIRYSELGDAVNEVLQQQETEITKQGKILKEACMERDILLEKVHGYLEQISSLKSKVEEQRCSIGSYERQVNAECEIKLRKMESVNEDLRNVAVQKEKQLKEANEQLKQMCKMLKSNEALSWRKKNEESTFISILKNDLQAIWNEKIKMEEEFKRLKRLCGYTEQDFQPRTSSDFYFGTILRKSKSMSDLTTADDTSEEAPVTEKVSSTSGSPPNIPQSPEEQKSETAAADQAQTDGVDPAPKTNQE